MSTTAYTDAESHSENRPADLVQGCLGARLLSRILILNARSVYHHIGHLSRFVLLGLQLLLSNAATGSMNFC